MSKEKKIFGASEQTRSDKEHAANFISDIVNSALSEEDMTAMLTRIADSGFTQEHYKEAISPFIKTLVKDSDILKTMRPFLKMAGMSGDSLTDGVADLIASKAAVNKDGILELLSLNAYKFDSNFVVEVTRNNSGTQVFNVVATSRYGPSAIRITPRVAKVMKNLGITKFEGHLHDSLFSSLTRAILNQITAKANAGNFSELLNIINNL